MVVIQNMDQKQLEKLKACELEMLKAFADACEKLQLKYFVIGGTLLGAVRHQGLIPWDDDIDVGMPRADYERFIAEGQKYLPEGYFVQTMHSDPEWPANFAKIRDCRTTFIEKSLKEFRINHGVWIDIFPFDYFPQGKLKRLTFGARYMLSLGRIVQTFSVPARKLTLRQLCKKMLFAASRVVHPDVAKAVMCRDELIRSVPAGPLMVNYCGAWGRREIAPAEYFAETIPMRFEGLDVQGLKHYDKWLTQVYGDYMQLPPVEKRVGHHDYEVLDLDKPYTEYIR